MVNHHYYEQRIFKQQFLYPFHLQCLPFINPIYSICTQRKDESRAFSSKSLLIHLANGPRNNYSISYIAEALFSKHNIIIFQGIWNHQFKLLMVKIKIYRLKKKVLTKDLRMDTVSDRNSVAVWKQSVPSSSTEGGWFLCILPEQPTHLRFACIPFKLQMYCKGI